MTLLMFDFTSGPTHAIAVHVKKWSGPGMPKRKKARQPTGRGTVLCIAAMIDRVTMAASLARNADMLLKKGKANKAFEVALNIEPLLHEANHLLQAACAFEGSRSA
jgi:hypothetical protein